MFDYIDNSKNQSQLDFHTLNNIKFVICEIWFESDKCLNLRKIIPMKLNKTIIVTY